MRRSGIVTVSYTSAGDESHNGDTILTLPVGYRPPIGIMGAAFAGSTPANFAVNASGAVKAWGSGTWRFGISFPVAN